MEDSLNMISEAKIIEFLKTTPTTLRCKLCREEFNHIKPVSVKYNNHRKIVYKNMSEEDVLRLRKLIKVKPGAKNYAKSL